MTSKHSSASRLLCTSLFDGLNSFADIEARISALPGNKERGDAFEIFAEAYLATQKIAQAQEVWPFEAVPLEQRKTLSLDTGRDMGVDGTYLTIDGELRAYQVKFRSNRPSLTWDELSTFMGLTDQVSQRVLFTNCEALPGLMQDRSGFVAIRGSDLDRLEAEDFEAMRQWLRSGQVKLPRKQPKPHQQEALTAISSGLAENDRATVVMACGTGKSLVALWAAERYGGKTLLILVPSLALVRQLLHEWLRETAWERFTFMCVCSDPTVAKGADDLVVHQADLDFPVTTDSATVSRFLGKAFDGIKIVFSTYQSAQVVAEGLPVGADGIKQSFDLAIFDEAHKTASREGTRFSFALEDANLPIRKRLFFTATPRHYDIRKKDKEGDSTLVYSMDRPEVYGPVIHTLSFAEAARQDIICDYKVVISVVTSEMVNDHVLKHGEVIVAGDNVKARQVALQIALQKAVEKYGVSRIFTFHGSVAAARSFTSDDGEGIRHHLPDFTTLHVSGEMKTSLREDQMKAFRQAEKAVISNARCLTEGVDVPAVDMVAFISPRKSKVDIVQATGRAMRKSPGKEFGYVMVPLFVEQAANESIEEALHRTGFDDIWDLLGAMREQDDVLTDIIRQMREDKGRTGGYDESRFSERVEVLGPSVSLDTIRESIAAECLDYLGVSWDERFGELLAFAEREGHCRVPRTYRTSDGYCLGSWMTNQRAARDRLPVDRIERLEAVPGWVWDGRAEQWEVGFNHLTEFVDREGNCQVPQRYRTTDEYRLGTWVTAQRAAINDLPVEKKERLEAVPGWVWDVLAEQWEIGFSQLTEFSDREGHCRVPANYQTTDGYRLGAWVANQRTNMDVMSVERKEQLEAISGWVWDVRAEQWEVGFRYLTEFADREGHCRVPANYQTTDGYRLGAWVVNQRATNDGTPAERKERLEAISGWVWDANAEQWELGFRHLTEFADREGHCKVPGNYRTADRYSLGEWVATQRTAEKNGKLSIERRNKLNEIGFKWNILEQWESRFDELLAYKTTHGNIDVPARYSNGLGSWLSSQKKKIRDGKLPEEQIDKLRGVGLSVEYKKRMIDWEGRFKELSDYKSEYGHVNVPRDFSGGLGTWAGTQRAAEKSGKLSAEKKYKLDEIEFGWDPIEDQWNDRFSELLTYKDEYGDVNVPIKWLSGLGMWVSVQRRSKKNGELPPEKIMKLDAIGFEWSATDSQWEERYNELLAYKAEYGDMLVPQKWHSGLGTWISNQKLCEKNGNLSDERRKRLDDIGFPWENRKPKTDWDERFNELLAYETEYRNLDVPRSWPTGLGTWIGNQKSFLRDGKLTPGREDKLRSIGLAINLLESRWESRR